VVQEFEEEVEPLALGSRWPASVVVAGPSSHVTIPGLMTDEVVGVLAAHAQVTKVAVNMSKDYDSGLHRAKSLSANFRPGEVATRTFRASTISRHRRQEFRQHLKENVELGVALAWPGIDNSWIGEFVHVARQMGTRTVVLIVTHPSSGQGATSIAREVADSDLVLVGDVMDAMRLSTTLGTKRPVIEVHRALSLTGRDVANDNKRLSTFLPKDDEQSLLNVLTAFDAVPSDWIGSFDLRVIMRYSGRTIPDHVAASFHSDHVQLIGEDFSSVDLLHIASDSSAMSVGDPAFDSRAYATAVNAGVPTVVLAGDMVTEVGRGYVGGLLADINRPASVYVGHNHALRLAELRFPGPDAWFDLAARLSDVIRDPSNDMNDFARS